jgi:hypothetical protein
MKQTVESTRLLRPSSASPSGAITAALGRIFLTASSFSSWVLIGYVVHLLVTAVVPLGVWQRRPGPGSAGLQRVLRLRGGHFFTINRKLNRTVPNRTEISIFGSSVWFRFLYLKSSVFGIVIGFHRIPNRNTKKLNYQTLSILKFDYLIM